MSNRKPIVGILFSSGCGAHSSESRLLATYLGAHLLWGGYSSVRLIGLPTREAGTPNPSSTNGDSEATTRAVKVMPMSGKAPVAVEAGTDFWFHAGIETIKDCHVIIVCVCSPDTEQCAKSLRAHLPKKVDDPMAIISFQHGPWNKNFKRLESELATTGHLTLDGAVGFHVVTTRHDGVIRCLAPGKLVVERLSKEKTDAGMRYLNLLSTMDIPQLFRKVMTPYIWGSMIHDSCHATNALMGGPLRNHLSDRTNRLIYAQMIRECLETFRRAAGDGKWAPDNGASCELSLGVLEQVLCLPSALFVPLSFVVLSVIPGAASPLQDDLHGRRRTSAMWTLGELIEVGVQQRVKMPACSHVHELLCSAIQSGNGVPSIAPSVLYDGIKVQFQSTKLLLSTTCAIFGGCFVLWLLYSMLDVFIPRDGL